MAKSKIPKTPVSQTLEVPLEDLQKVVAVANQIEALLDLLPDGSSVAALLEPMDTLFGEALYGAAEVATAVLEASKREEKGGAK